MRILFIGDIVAKAGRDVVAAVLPKARKEKDIDLVIANADNLTHGRGTNEEHIKEMMGVGVDFFTGGDHLFYHEDLEENIDSLPVVRAANYPDGAPGEGYKLVDLGEKGSVLVMSLTGRTFLNEKLSDPFTTASNIVEKYDDNVVKIIDFHAEATSEKYALGFYLDGKVDAVLGTHTHVPTCDNI
ncbi:MAG: TIGR00282 family metallophosphoesterase, partial [Patescibacteria group bacterium]